MSIDSTQSYTVDEGPKIGFLETFYGVLFSPSKVFEDLYKEDTFTVMVYGALAVFLSNFGKVKPEDISLLSLIGIEIIGFISWFFVALFIFFFSTVFKSPNNNLGRLLGFTGLANIPYLLLTSVNLVSCFVPQIHAPFSILISIWVFILFWLSLAKSFQLESWRVLLMAIIPFLLGLFLFTFLIANIIGLMFSVSP